MEGAAQPAILQPAEGEVGAAMRAVAIDQAVAALLVAEQHQLFAEQLHGAHRARALQLIDQRRRLPVAPHQLAARILRADAGDQVVLLLAHHGASPHRVGTIGACVQVTCRYLFVIEHLFNIVTQAKSDASDTFVALKRKAPCPS